MDKKKIKRVLLSAIEEAGESLRKDYYTLKESQIKLKSKRDIVTSADLKSEKIIIGAIKKNFPDHTILSEESGLNKNVSDYLWIIDPLDGTTNFSFRNPIWAIAIALAYKEELIFSAVYIPLQNELIFAEKGKGFYLNGKKAKMLASTINKINTFCHGSSQKDIKRAIKYYSHQKLHSLDCRQLGSAETELAYVALGRVDSLLIPGAKLWDSAAGALLVSEAGGVVTNFKGEPWNIKQKNILAANPKTHKEILKIIKKIKL